VPMTQHGHAETDSALAGLYDRYFASFPRRQHARCRNGPGLGLGHRSIFTASDNPALPVAKRCWQAWRREMRSITGWRTPHTTAGTPSLETWRIYRRARRSGVDGFRHWRGPDQIRQLRSHNGRHRAHGFTLLATMPQLEREHTHAPPRRH